MPFYQLVGHFLKFKL